MATKMHVGLALVAGLLVAGAAQAAPITAHLTGTIYNISQVVHNSDGTTTRNGLAQDSQATFDIGDSASITLVFDPDAGTIGAAFDDAIIYSNVIQSISASLNGGAAVVAYDPTATGNNNNSTWLWPGTATYFAATDFGVGGGDGGTVTGQEFANSDPQFFTNWLPMQFVIFMDNVTENSPVPSMPQISEARIDWWATGERVESDGSITRFNLQQGVNIGIEQVSFEGVTDGPADVPAPAGLPLLIAGLLALGLRRKA